MITVKILIFSLLLLLVSFAEGKAFVKLSGKVIAFPKRITFSLFSGFIVTMLSGMIIGFVSGFAGIGVNISLIIWLVLLLLLVVLSLFVKADKNNEGATERKNTKLGTISHLIFLALLIVQAFAVTYYRYEQIETGRKIYIATRVYESGLCQKSLEIMNVWGMISRLLQLHPLVLMYSVMPTVMLLLFYMGYYEVLMSLSDGDSKLSITALVILELVQIWGYQSQLLLPITLLFSWFSTETFLIHSLIPFLGIVIFYYRKEHPKVINRDEDYDAGDEDEEIQEEWDMKKHKIINARNLAIGLGVLTVILFAFVFILNNKINTLHASTVNMQEDLNKRCAVYEFVGKSTSVEGYLIKGSDGSLTMIGGGSAENAEDLYDFIEKHGGKVSDWYLYGMDEENAGAYVYCKVNKGLSVTNAYVLDRAQIPEITQ